LEPSLKVEVDRPFKKIEEEQLFLKVEVEQSFKKRPLHFKDRSTSTF